MVWSPQLALEKLAAGQGGLRVIPVMWNMIARFAWKHDDRELNGHIKEIKPRTD
jgi:hypothetical protein